MQDNFTRVTKKLKMSSKLKITLILSICMRQKNGDEVPRTKKYVQSGTKKTPSPENGYNFFFGFKSLCICKE